MASTQDQITANLVALGFDNESAAAIYEKFAEAAGIPVDNTISEITNSESIITNLLISLNGYGKKEYYEAAALAFQYGDDLTVNMAINPVTGMPYLTNIYAVVDASKQIIKKASFDIIGAGNNIELVLKVATTDINGNLIALSPDQLAAFSNYFSTVEIPGLPVTIVSIAGNVFNFQAVATYLAAYDLPTLQANISAASTAFKTAFSFDSNLYVGLLQDYMTTNVPGLKDFYVYNTTIDGIPFGGSANLTAGYFNYIDGFLANITYNPVNS